MTPTTSAETPTGPCVCRQALQHSFSSVRDAVYGADDMSVILENSELIATSEEKWMRLLRCRVCGTVWAEACYTSGQMDFYYLLPAPPTADPVRWLHEEAAELPA